MFSFVKKNISRSQWMKSSGSGERSAGFGFQQLLTHPVERVVPGWIQRAVS
jgi:hypothetical protein